MSAVVRKLQKGRSVRLFMMNEIRRYLRTGMGLCQGQTCGKLVQSIVARELGVKPSDLQMNTARSPVRPTEMGVYGNEIIEQEGKDEA